MAAASSPAAAPGRNIHQLSIDVDKSAAAPPSRRFQGRPSPFAPYLGGGVLYRPPTPAALLLAEPTSTPAAAAAAFPTKLSSSTRAADAPEKQLTLFAMRLAAMEKVASHVGTLAFVWATVVLLGGFAITLKEIDFWFVTVILVIEGARIFSRSHELEWQHQDGSNSSGSLFSWAYQKGSQVFSTLTSDGATPPENGGAATLLAMHKPRRTWSTSSVPIFPWIHIRAKHISRLFYWAQIVAAVAATTMAVYRLITRQFTRPNEVEDGTYNNHSSALLIFYSLATFEAAVFLLERIYWELQISYRKILINVNKKSGLQDADLATTRRFFYDVYSKCLNDSIFAGLDMDLVDYALSALQSDQSRQQLGGLRVLLAFCQRPAAAAAGPDDETLRSIGVKQGAVERLLEMVTWKNPEAYDIRNSAANLLCELVKSNRYSVRVASVSGAIEGIFSLLVSNEDRDAMEAGGMELCATPEAAAPLDGALVAAKVMDMRVVGLRILKNLAKDPVNSAKIGATRGLLTRLVTFIDTNKAILSAAGQAPPQIPQIKKALQLLNLLAAAPGSTGRTLREDIAKIVFTVSNLQKIIEFGEAHISLQFYAMEILSSLAMADEGVKASVGRAGGVMRGLLAVLLRRRCGDDAHIQLAQKAGEALALLALKDKENCRRMMALRIGAGGEVLEEEEEEEGKGVGAAEELVELIDDYEVGDIAMDILRSFCAYSEEKPEWKWREACERKAARVWKERGGKAQVAAMGLAAKLAPEVGRALEQEGMSAEEVAGRLGGSLVRWAEAPPPHMPRGRRYAAEMVLGLAKKEGFKEAFRRKEIRKKLRNVWRTVTDVEDYATFSGSAGVCPHAVPMAELLRLAMRSLQYDDEDGRLPPSSAAAASPSSSA